MYIGMRKYGVQTVFDFAVYDIDGVDLDTDWVPAAADCELIKDGGASTQCTNTAADEGVTYSITLTATEMQCARGVIKVQDAATKVILDIVLTFDTYGNASAQHAVDMDDAVRMGLTALPNAVADAAGGLAISDAGGLDLDAILADTADIQPNYATSAAQTTAQNDLDTITGTSGVLIGTDAANVTEISDAVWDEATSAHAIAGSFGKSAADVLVDTADIQPNYATEAKQDTAQTDLDTITGTAGVLIGTDAANVTEIEDAVWDAVLTGNSHNNSTSAGRRLRQIDQAFFVTEGTADAGGASTIDLETGVASTTDDIYNGDRILIVAGTGAGEHGLILDYVGSTQQATMSKAWVVTPDNTSEYILVPADCDVELWNDNSVTGDGDWAQLNTDVNDVPTTAEFEARTLVAASYFDPAADTVATVTSVTNEVTADVTKISGDSTAANNLEASMETLLVGTATGGSTSTVTSAATGYGDDTFIGRLMVMRTGTLQYEAGVITDYDSVAGTFTFAASTWTTSPTTETWVVV